MSNCVACGKETDNVEINSLCSYHMKMRTQLGIKETEESIKEIELKGKIQYGANRHL